MALRVWLPLTKDLSNQGLSDITVTNNGATFSSAGKLGGCYSFTSSSGQYIALNTMTLPSNKLTFCIWGKYTSWDNWSRLFDFGSTTSGAGDSILLTHSNTSNNFYVGLKTGGTSRDISYSANLSLNTWYHFAITKDGTIWKFYLNGNLISTQTATGDFTNNTITFNNNYLGRSNWSADSYLNGYLNDFRIYDECLSARQIKEISKGLVLHYPLKGVDANPNLIVGSSKYIYSSPFTHTSSAKDGIIFVGSDVWMSCTPGTTYTFSFNTDGPWSPSHDTSGSGGGKTHFYLYLMEDSTTAGSYSKPVDLTNNYKTNSNTTGLGTWTYTIPTDKTYTKIMFRIDIHSDGSTSYSYKYWNFKAEVGTKATPWIPNITDTLYSTYEYSNMLVEDVSGYKNDGTVNGTLTSDSDSPRYNCSTYFDGSSYISLSNPFKSGSILTEFSHTAWAKWNSSCSTSAGIHTIAGDNNFFRISLGKSNKVWAYALRSIADGSSTSPSGVGQYGSASDLVDGQWYFIGFTFKNGICKTYLNGELLGTVDNSSTYPAVKSAIDSLFIGSYSNSSETAIGNISDSRFYATALSADDIKELYEVGATIDNNGNMYAYEFQEE